MLERLLCYNLSKLQNRIPYLLFVVCFMVGCSQHKPPHFDDPTLPTHVSDTSDAYRIKTQKRLIQEGIHVTSIGQDYLISIPSSMLFLSQSPKLTWESYGVLNDVACYIRQFRTVSIYVEAMTTKFGSPQREHALTLARASAVGQYLLSRGIDSRLIFTRGLGSDKPIVAVKRKTDAQHNSRVDITFRNTIV